VIRGEAVRAVVLAGGRGTRLAPYTNVFPKPLVPVGDMPILQVVIHQLRHYGFTHITLAVGYLATLMQAFFQDGGRYGVKIDYVVEDEPLGTAGPLAFVPDLDDVFLVMNGDVLTTLNYTELFQYHERMGAAATVAMHKREVKVDLGVIQLDGDNRIRGYIEKPLYDYNVSMGIYVFAPCVLDYIPSGRYFDFPDLVHRLLEGGEAVIGYPYEGYWLDIGRRDDYEQAVRDFEKMRSSFLLEEDNEVACPSS
jgi:NDP-sugar pyrophosphorylase family protein